LCQQIVLRQPAHAESVEPHGHDRPAQWRTEAGRRAGSSGDRGGPGKGGASFQPGRFSQGAGNNEQAVAAYEQALAWRPQYVEALHNLAIARWDQGQLDRAIECYQKALHLRPDLAEARNNLANAWKETGRPDAAIAEYEGILRARPEFAAARSNLIYLLQYDPGSNAARIQAELARWRKQFAEPLKQSLQPHSNDRGPGRRLRVGYVSPDFRNHAAGRLILPLLAHHDRLSFEIVCYSDVPADDELTHRIQAHADVWRRIRGMADQAVAEQIRRDQIDVLVDLTMHMAGNRLLVFARKPAPMQITWLAYPGTTGIETMG